MSNSKIYFDHEKLKAYRESLRFYAWCEPVQPDRLREDAPEYLTETQE
jgi:hypothetical protein